MSTVATALELTRSYLNDDDRVNWSDARLMPKVRQAHLELIAKMQLNGLPVIKAQSAVILVTAGATDLGVDQPANLVEPDRVFEFPVGGPSTEAVDMGRKAYLPNWEITDTLRVWAWRENKITFLGANTPRNIILYYKEGYPAPTQVSDALPIIGSEIFIGPRVASLAVNNPSAANDADRNLSLIVRRMVKTESNLPARRRPFSARYRRGRGTTI